jgi:lysyl-tRNA synthetase class 2
MKRLLSAGYPKIFQICGCFRQAERGERHLPAFTLLEWYHAGIDYFGLMDECEQVIRFVSRELGLGEKIEYQGKRMDLRAPWHRVSVKEAFLHYASVPVEETLASDRFDEIMVEKVEPRLGAPKPTFVYDYPASLAALSRIKKGAPECAERFELYMAGLEVANGFSELTSAREQRARFEKEREKRLQLGKTVYPIPEKFLEAVAHMPESAGIALGVDRLVMLFTNQRSIDDVVSFTPEEL